MSTINDINKRIERLWEEYSDKLQKTEDILLYPYIYPTDTPREDVILFVGMNPSFVPEEYTRILKSTNDPDFANFNPFTIYNWEKRDEENKRIIIKAEKIMRVKYGFFQKFSEIISGTGLQSVHIDLFSIRITNQKELESQILKSKDDKLKSFIEAEFSIFVDLVRYINPKAIVVSNARVSKFFENKEGGKYIIGSLGKMLAIQWKERTGYHTAHVNNKQIPLFLTSMLSGQRALDDGSFRRLKWQVINSLKL